MSRLGAQDAPVLALAPPAAEPSAAVCDPAEAEPDGFCVICQEGVPGGQRASLGAEGCTHAFHASCIAEWLAVEALCPVCRRASGVWTAADGVEHPVAPAAGRNRRGRGADGGEDEDLLAALGFLEDGLEGGDAVDPLGAVVCSVCGSGGDEARLLMCDSCDGATHTLCAGLDCVPAGDWHCAECEAAEEARRRRHERRQERAQERRRRRQEEAALEARPRTLAGVLLLRGARRHNARAALALGPGLSGARYQIRTVDTDLPAHAGDGHSAFPATPLATLFAQADDAMRGAGRPQGPRAARSPPAQQARAAESAPSSPISATLPGSAERRVFRIGAGHVVPRSQDAGPGCALLRQVCGEGSGSDDGGSAGAHRQGAADLRGAGGGEEDGGWDAGGSADAAATSRRLRAGRSRGDAQAGPRRQGASRALPEKEGAVRAVKRALHGSPLTRSLARDAFKSVARAATRALLEGSAACADEAVAEALRKRVRR